MSAPVGIDWTWMRSAFTKMADAFREVTFTLTDVDTDALNHFLGAPVAEDPSKRPFTCRRHGPQTTHGYCRPCQRS